MTPDAFRAALRRDGVVRLEGGISFEWDCVCGEECAVLVRSPGGRPASGTRYPLTAVGIGEALGAAAASAAG